MSLPVLVLSPSGRGKTTSARTLPPSETYFIQSVKKILPFKNAKQNYTGGEKPGAEDNLLITDDMKFIYQMIKAIDRKKPEIKNIVIDDFQYLMSNYYLKHKSNKGWEVFDEIARGIDAIIQAITEARDDLMIVVIAHTIVEEGEERMLTLGRFLKEKGSIEGKFSITLKAVVEDGEYLFSTKNNGMDTVKTPLGMFEEEYIPNDLLLVRQAIMNYL